VGTPTSAAAEMAVHVFEPGSGAQISVTFEDGASTTYERRGDFSGMLISETP